jgi:hypothetical protein
MSLSLASPFTPRKKKAGRPDMRHRLPLLERLEDRTVLSVTFSNPATLSGDVTLNGTSGNDQFIIRLGATAGTIQFSDDNGNTFTTANVAGITSVTVNGNGGKDQLTLDMSNGVIGRAGTSLPISFNAGSTGHSTLTVLGNPPAANGTVSEVFTAGIDATSGTLTINASGTGSSTPAAGSASDSITLTHVSLLQDTMNAASFTVNGTDQNEEVLISNGTTLNGFATNLIQGLNTGHTGERDEDMNTDRDQKRQNEGDDRGGGDDVTHGNGFLTFQFANKATVSVNTLGGNDLIVLNVTKAAAGLKTLNLDGGAGNNFLAQVSAPPGVTLNLANLPQANQMTDADDVFVEEQFEQNLGRAGDLNEIGFWKGILNSGGKGAGRLNVIQGIAKSDEGLDVLVRGLYRQYLGRDALNGEEKFWVSLLKDNETEEQVISDILGSQEFFNLAQTQVITGTPNERFVTAVYQVLLGRTPRSDEVTYWTNLLQTTTDRTQAVAQFLESPEFRTDVITALYGSLLNRTPDQPGLKFWLAPQFNIDSVRAGIMSSAEFQSRFDD